MGIWELAGKRPFVEWNVIVFIIDFHAVIKRNWLLFLVSSKFDDLERERKRLNQFFLFVTTCMYTDDRSKTIPCQYIEEKEFPTPFFWHGLHRTHLKGTMPYSLKRSPSTETEILTILVPRLKNGLKFVAQQNHDIFVSFCFAYKQQLIVNF